jgi:hypothetical protein
VGAGGEMTQALYAHMNNKRKRKKKKKKKRNYSPIFLMNTDAKLIHKKLVNHI